MELEEGSVSGVYEAVLSEMTSLEADSSALSAFVFLLLEVTLRPEDEEVLTETFLVPEERTSSVALPLSADEVFTLFELFSAFTETDSSSALYYTALL